MRQIRQVYYGWWIAGACFVFVGARRGSETAYAVLLVALEQEFGWERATITGAFSLAMLAGGFLTPLAGMLLDRCDPRLTFGLGTLALGLTALTLPLVQRVWHLYVIMIGLFSLTLALLQLGTLSAYLARWFVRQRAMAMGLSQAGQGLGIFGLTPLVTWLIAIAGWRGGYLWFGAGLILLLVPLNFLILRTTPQHLGLLPDGGAAAHTPVGNIATDFATGTWTLEQARRTPLFWALLLCFYFFPAANQIFMIHLVAYLTDQGIAKITAAFMLSFAGLVSIPGRLLFGFLTDRLGGILATQISFALSILSVVLILLSQSQALWMVYGFAVVFGLSLGSRGVTLGSLTADSFPGREFGAIYSWITSGQLIGGALGPWLAGVAFDTTGSYRLVFYGCIGAFVTSALTVGLAAHWMGRERQVLQ